MEAPTIHGRARTDDVWVGDRTLQHWDGTTWSAEYNVDGDLAPGLVKSMSGAASDDVWAVGDGNPFAAHWDGAAWKLSALPAGASAVNGVYAPSRTEGFIVGAAETEPRGVIYEWDGTSWQAVAAAPEITVGAGETLLSHSWAAITGRARPRP